MSVAASCLSALLLLLQSPCGVSVNRALPHRDVSETLTTAASATATASSGSGQLLPQGLGWHQMATMTALQPSGVGGANDKCPANNFGGSDYGFDDKCRGIIWAWNGAAYDSTHRAFVLGASGGHTDYAGNEVYILDMSTATAVLLRATNPTVPTAGSCTEAISGRPNSRHTYNGVAYIPSTDEYMIVGGSLACLSGTEGNDTWTLAMASVTGSCAATPGGCTPTWTQRGAPPNACNLDGKKITYSSARDLVFMDDRCNNFFSYNPSTHVWTRLANAPDFPLYASAVEDPDNQFMVLVGQGTFASRSIASGSTWAVTGHGDASCSALTNAAFPGLAYDPVDKRIVGHIGTGSNVVVLNTNTWTCATESLGGTTPPDATVGNGDGVGMVFGRWRYMAPEDAFVYYPNYNVPGYYYRRRTTSGERSFQSRCSDSAVTACFSLGTSGDISGFVFPGSVSTPALDAAVHTESTAGSLLAVVAACCDAATAGYWSRNIGHDFGQGETLYYTYRYRVDPQFLTQNYNAAGWKMHILWSNVGGSCSDLQTVTLNEFYAGYPRIYRSCGTPEMNILLNDGDNALNFGAGGQHGADPTWTQSGTGPSANGGYYQTRRQDGAGENNGFRYVGDNWMTWYYKITIGTWNANNSKIEAWVALEGQAMKKWMDLDQLQWPNDNTAAKRFRQLDLLPYDTGRNSTVPLPANVRYAEVIVSTGPILPPTGAQP